MNPITKAVNTIRCRRNFIKRNVNENNPEARKTAIYTESGWIAEVEILADDSDAEQYRYRLKVIKTLMDGYLGRLQDGHIFNVFAVKKYAVNCGWKLSAIDF